MTKDMKLSELADELEARYLAWKNIGDARILADRKRVEFAEACYAAMPAILTALRDSTDRDAVERYRHKARGTEYDLLGTAELQDASGNRVEEGALLAIYRGDDGKLWARRHSEFGDGRFERLKSSPTNPSEGREADNRPVCSADGCHRREPCGPFCRDKGNFK